MQQAEPEETEMRMQTELFQNIKTTVNEMKELEAASEKLFKTDMTGTERAIYNKSRLPLYSKACKLDNLIKRTKMTKHAVMQKIATI